MSFGKLARRGREEGGRREGGGREEGGKEERKRGREEERKGGSTETMRITNGLQMVSSLIPRLLEK